MSSDIYGNVIRTESEDMNSERVEMTVTIYESADCLRDQDFGTNTQQPLQQTGSDCVRKKSSRASKVCLALLCFLLLTAVIALSVYIYTNNTKYTEERRQLLTNITNLAEDRNELLKNITNLTEDRNELLKNITNLTEDRNELLKNITNLTEERDQQNKKLKQWENKLVKCFNEMEGWFYRSSCYFFSSEKKNWKASRQDCTDRGADLIIINNKEEQDFVKKSSADDQFWIGLTNVEGWWKWVDGTNVISGFRSWSTREPSGQKRKNCALTHKSKWHDYPCQDTFKWICEKTFLK